MRYEIILPLNVKWGTNNNMDRNAREELNLSSAYYVGSWYNRQLWDIDCEPEIYSWLTLKYGLERAPDLSINDLVGWEDNDEEYMDWDDNE